MSTSVNPLRIARSYAIVAAVCLVFALVYAQFSHGVHSPFMSWMFLIPALAGALPALVLALMGRPAPAMVVRQLWGLAVAALTVASCLRGIFEIAGTGSDWLFVYVAAGGVLAVAAAVMFARDARTACRA